jgi:hypothetical protein
LPAISGIADWRVDADSESDMRKTSV